MKMEMTDWWYLPLPGKIGLAVGVGIGTVARVLWGAVMLLADGVVRFYSFSRSFFRLFFSPKLKQGYVLRLTLSELRLVSAAVLPCGNVNFRMIGVAADRIHLKNKITDEMARACRGE